MSGFIEQVAECLYKKYGDEISSLTVLFPSRRARLFFNDSLTGLASKPLWQPEYATMDSLMEKISGLTVGDPIRIISELYKIYSKYHKESFDSFYFWGEMLVSDFDSIDKYMIDAGAIFRNISDLKNIEDHFEYLTTEQAEVIARFWNSFGHQSEFSDEKQKFVDIWRTLEPIYSEFREVLTRLGIAYPGMMYREAADRIKAGTAATEPGKRYAIAGFNALSETEKILFGFLDKNHEVDFFWDYDEYYLRDENQEAGLFLRENVRRFPQKTPFSSTGHSLLKPKNITVVSSPSDTMQCKYVGELLKELQRDSNIPIDKETAIVLTDENLLIPVLHSIPESVEKINVTMGYPIRFTSAYTFVERLILLQYRKRMGRGDVKYYHSDVCGLLRHPYVIDITSGRSIVTSDAIVEHQQIYVDHSMLCGEEVPTKIFGIVPEGWRGLSDYLLTILSDISRNICEPDQKDSYEDKQQVEFIAILLEQIGKLANSLSNCDIEVSEKIYASLLRRILQNVRIPFEGEPLQGIQVMGILETRNLDFKNVVLLSMTDDTFPGNRAVSSSFIPYNLRFAYGLPTPAHHEGVYAYYFYRLLQRAENVCMVYSSRSEEKSSGEQSRYIYQLEYEMPHRITRKDIGLDVNLSQPEPIVIDKAGHAAKALQDFLVDGDKEARRKLSPTSFFNFICCPVKFYFYSIAGLAEDRQINEDVDAPMFGTILHAAMEILYAPIVGKHNPQQYISGLIGSEAVARAVNDSIRREYFHGASVSDEDYGGNLILIRDIVIKYINKCILPYDSKQEDLMILKMEERIQTNFRFECEEGWKEITLGGLADRIDRIKDGGYRIVDYKTGKDHLVFNGVESLFSGSAADRNSAALQTFLYSMMLGRTLGTDEIQPSLYYVRQMNNAEYSPLLDDKSRGSRVGSYLDYRSEFEENLAAKLRELFDPSVPFIQSDDTKQCQWCDFNPVCKR